LTLHELGRRLKPFDIRDEVVDVLRETSGDIVKANQDQLGLGLLSTGKEIKNLKTRSYFYSQTWERYRKSLGLQVEYFDLKVTGAFWRSINVSQISVQSYLIYASDPKTDSILDMFGDEILGLAPEQKTNYVHTVFAPALRQRITQKVGI
jgi:hypothetical protein